MRLGFLLRKIIRFERNIAFGTLLNLLTNSFGRNGFLDKPLTLHVPKDMLEKLSAHVTIRDEVALRAFVADAINSYTQIGSLEASGFAILAEDPEGKQRRLRFPTDAAVS